VITLLQNQTSLGQQSANWLFDEIVLSIESPLSQTVRNIVKTQLLIHKVLTQMLLSKKYEVTSKGKSICPEKKLQKSLKKHV
jgi:hypothetical protein